MGTLVLYYSWGGSTRRLAQRIAKEEDAQLCEAKDVEKPGTVRAYVLGSLAARRQRAWPILPLGESLDTFDKIVLMAPVWWGFPAPAFNSMVALLPAGKSVEVVLVSGSGGSAARQKVTALIEARGCRLAGWRDVRGADAGG